MEFDLPALSKRDNVSHHGGIGDQISGQRECVDRLFESIKIRTFLIWLFETILITVLKSGKNPAKSIIA
jgi:hypothetical protein